MQTIRQMFLDGWCDILGSDERAQGAVWRRNVPYQLRTVGSKRFFEAEMAGHTVSRVIRLPELGVPLNNCEVRIGGQVYQIVQVQEIVDTSPRCLQLTLEQTGVAWAAQQPEG